MKQYNSFFVGSTKLVFGRGASAAAGEELLTAGKSRVLVVTDPFIAKSGMLAPLIEGLERCKIAYEVFDKVESDPSSEVVASALERLNATGCEAVIGFGGGSAMDTAKGARILATNGGNLFDYDNSPTGGKTFKNQGLFLISVPTTAGTGSEVTSYAIITNKAENRKTTITSPKICSDVALIDPELTLNLPAGLTASTGMDALAHAIGGYTSSRVIGAPGSTQLSDIMAVKAIELVARNLRTAVTCGNVYEARSNMMMASTLGAMACNAGGDATHGLGHALGGVYHVPHGTACAIVMPYVLEYNYISCPERYIDIARAFGIKTETMSVMDAAASCADAIKQLIKDINIPPLKTFVPNLEDEKFQLLCEQTVAEKCSIITLCSVIPGASRWWLVIPVGAVFAVVYYFLFTFLITKFNFATPGREAEDQNIALDTSVVEDTYPYEIIKAFGGAANMESVGACFTRLRVTVKDAAIIDEIRFKQLGAKA